VDALVKDATCIVVHTPERLSLYAGCLRDRNHLIMSMMSGMN